MSLTIVRHFTREIDSNDPIEILGAELAYHHAKITGGDGETVFEADNVEAPASWSKNAVNIFAKLYLRKAGVPSNTIPLDDPEIPGWLQKRVPGPGATFGPETSVLQTLWRIANAWTHHGFVANYFATEHDSRIFRDEIFWLLANQRFAPNSPQFFNTGLHWAYGIHSPSEGYFRVDPETLECYQTPDSYEQPQTSACFINSVDDNLVQANGIMDLWHREARLFRFGSGSGTNFSTLRAANEPLSGGGKSSGLISFLKIGDTAAGSIKSGGTTRRAAKMNVLDIDHPDILEFINWKLREETKVAMLVAGSSQLRKHAGTIQEAVKNAGANPAANPALATAIRLAEVDGVPRAMINRVIQSAEEGIFDLNLPQLDTNWQGEAYLTVSGQNANNSVRYTGAFLAAVDADLRWSLKSRTNRDNVIEVPARTIWDSLCYAAWATGDPGIQFDDTINDWHTCTASGRINGSNPCSEYMFLDNSACNLATLNLYRFLRADRTYDIDGFQHASRLGTIVLDITVGMSHYPSRTIAENSFRFRPLGLNYTNLGGTLMASGLAYNSTEGRQFAAAVTALMTGVAYMTSAELAESLGAFEGYEENQASMRHVIYNHYALATGEETSDLAVVPIGLPAEPLPSTLNTQDIISRAQLAWETALQASASTGFRNSQVTLLAPNGTTGPAMDSATLGLEPEFALLKFKSLAGGGSITIANPLVPAALKTLGYNPQDIAEIDVWTQSHGTPEGCPTLKVEHLPVFDCANRCTNGQPEDSPTYFSGTRYLSAEAHLNMMAAVQPFLSGAISKTVNLPRETTTTEIGDIYRIAYRLGLKAIAIYRDESKLSQPLTTTKTSPQEIQASAATEAPQHLVVAAPPENARARRIKLPHVRRGITQKATVGGHRIYVRTGDYPDGALGEIFIDSHREGSAFKAMMNYFAISVSIGLQYGVPLEEFVDAFCFTRSDPSGPVQDHDYIKNATSAVDYIFRHLAIYYLGRTDLAHAIPADPTSIREDNPPTEARHSEVKPLSKPATKQDRINQAIRQGYEGDACGECANFTLIRQGTCTKCQTCGATGGCS